MLKQDEGKKRKQECVRTSTAGPDTFHSLHREPFMQLRPGGQYITKTTALGCCRQGQCSKCEK